MFDQLTRDYELFTRVRVDPEAGTVVRPPELFGGALLLLRAVLGISPDVPGGTLHLRPLRPFPFRRLTLEGMPLAGGRLSLAVEADALTVTGAPDGLAVTVCDR